MGLERLERHTAGPLTDNEVIGPVLYPWGFVADTMFYCLQETERNSDTQLSSFGFLCMKGGWKRLSRLRFRDVAYFGFPSSQLACASKPTTRRFQTSRKYPEQVR